jgi:acyl dehydratase
MKIFNDVRELSGLVGQTVAVGDWMEVDQKRVNTFAEATGDFQWIHLDVERARTGPYGGTIAHGFLTLSLLPQLTANAIKFERVVMGINYGLNKVRFPAPVKVGAKVRGQFKLVALNELPPMNGLEGFEVVMEATIETDAGGKPACIAETISRRYQRPQ